MLWALVIAAAAGFYAYYRHSLHRHPTRPCRSCGGKGQHFDKIWKRASGRCHSCNGRGYHPRLGLRIFSGETYRAIRAGRHDKNY